MRQRDLLPLPLPFGDVFDGPANHPSRWVRRRVRAKQSWQGWANDGVVALNHLSGQSVAPDVTPTPCQKACLDRISRLFLQMGKPPVLSAVGAFKELCGNRVPYISEGGGPEPYHRGNVSLPVGGGITQLGTATFPTAHLDLLEGLPARLLNSPDDTRHALEECGLESPFVDAAFKSPVVYGEFLQELLAKDLIEFQHESPARLGCFLSERSQDSSG